MGLILPAKDAGMYRASRAAGGREWSAELGKWLALVVDGYGLATGGLTVLAHGPGLRLAERDGYFGERS